MFEVMNTFQDYFAHNLGVLSKALSSIPGVDTDHNGANFILTTPDKRWTLSIEPVLNAGHTGHWKGFMSFQGGVGIAVEAAFNSDGSLKSFSHLL